MASNLAHDRPAFDGVYAWWKRALSTNDADTIRRQSVRRDYETGQFFNWSLDSRCVYFVEAGLLRLYRVSDGGREISMGFVGPGEPFGELTDSGCEREGYAQAVRSSSVWRTPRAVIAELVALHPALALEFTRLLVHRLRRIEDRLASMAFGNVRARLASTLLQLAKDFGRGEGDTTVIDVDLRQEDLASLIGASRQTVNVEMRALADARVIELTGRRMVLRDLVTLRDLQLHERT